MLEEESKNERATNNARFRQFILFAALIVFVCIFETQGLASPLQVTQQSRPNIMIILADDLGFSDLGCFGGEIETPNLDALANAGMRFSQFYNTGRCWPTRAALLTGYYAQQIQFDDFPGEGRTKRKRPKWAPTIANKLKQAGYRCYHSGKWHVDGQPIESGFDHSYRLADHGRYFSPKNHQLDSKPLPQPTDDDDFYTTTAIAQHAIDFLTEHHSEYSEMPFFAFVAFTSPHFPLHARPEDIAKYRGRYDAGWNELRRERLVRIEEMALLDNVRLSEVEPDVGPPYDFPQAMKTLGEGETNRPLPWSELTATQTEFQTAKMEIHAAMVDRMDQEIGRILSQINSMGATENTLIFFLSDNGASAEIMVRDDGHDSTAVPGSAKSHLCLGPGWSNAANTPFRRHKTWVHEGGIHTPLIVSWPSRIKTGMIRREPGHVVDLFPTILEAAKIEREDEVVPRPGISLLDWITSEKLAKNSDAKRTLWWLHEGNAALRVGNWKLVRSKGNPWELFDLASDPTEQNDLSQSNAEQKQLMIEQWNSKTRQHHDDAETPDTERQE